MNIIAVNDRFAESGKKTRPALQHRLSVYDTPPTHNVTLDEFQEGAYDRITGKPLVSADLKIPHARLLIFCTDPTFRVCTSPQDYTRGRVTRLEG